ncbi:hypothetical protein [Cellulomonas soli]|uniref:Lipoprotein n=1 Tax=Cellulomonas soli TaxID=931535 RepID=A0A512PHT8_9CELL|nr:hypothetical protein [Cellulomonas soli]NYI59237.1 hypothetical protein [Cellulomonas soli]GEP70743.1 hypothetical protein CSO01_34580 [Cellulomonas soli]
MTRGRDRLARHGRRALVVAAILTLTSCAGLRAEDADGPSRGDPVVVAPTRTAPAAGDPAAGAVDASSQPVDEAAVKARIQEGLPEDALPDGFRRVEQYENEDVQPFLMLATAQYEAYRADPAADRGPVVVVRVVSVTPADRALEPATPGPEVTAEPRDDIAPGAVLYHLDGQAMPSITVPAATADIIIAGTDIDTDVLVAIAKAVIR